MRQTYKVNSIKLVSSNVNETGYEKYEVFLTWKDKTGIVREVKDSVLVNPFSTVYGKVSTPFHIKYPSSHTFIVDNQKFSTLGSDVDAGIMKNVAKSLIKFFYPIEGKQYCSLIF